MIRYFHAFFLAVFLLAAIGAAGAQPMPTVLGLPNGDAVPGVLRGTGFGPEADVGSRPGPVVSVQDLRSCLVIADTLALTPDRWAHIARTTYWRDDMVAFRLDRVPAAARDCLYLFLIDADGAASLPIGPLPAADGYLVPADERVVLREVSRDLWDNSQVILLSPESQEPATDCLEFDTSRQAGGPGMPGTPVRID